MGQKQQVQVELSVGKQGPGRLLPGFLRVAAAAVDQDTLPIHLQQHALPLADIQNGRLDLSQAIFQPREAHARRQTDSKAQGKLQRPLLLLQQKHRQQQIRKNHPRGKIDTAGIDRGKRQPGRTPDDPPKRTPVPSLPCPKP